jgi:hypothetical protein
MAELCNDLNRMFTELNEEQKEEEETHNAIRLQSLMSARDIAANAMVMHEKEACNACPGSQKRKQHVQMYKHHHQEWINLMKQALELQDLPFNENDYDNHLSFSDDDE